MKNKILIVLLCCITTLGYAQEVDELLQATSAIEMLDGTTRASSSNATSQATLRCVQVIKPEVSAILQQVCRMQDLIEIIIEDLGDVSISDELIISQLAAICSKIENININVSIGDVALTAVCDLDPVISAIDNTEQVLCSKLELIESQLDNLSISACDVNLDPVLTAIDNSEQVLCSKLEIIDSKLDNLNISLSCDFDPVITAIDESEQILCSKLEIIDSKLDVLNLSHIEVVVGPITFTVGDLNITAICDFTSVLDAISESDALLCSKLEIIESILEVPSCATTPITGPTTITAEGSYCVADTINGAIEVNANNVTIDLNGYHITGSIIIDDGVEYPYIFGPGMIDGGSPAIYVAGSVLGVKNLRLSDLTVRNGSVGIALENVFGGHISNVEMTQNNTGIELTNSYNITIQDSVATSNSNAGYSLISSFTNCIRNSKAVGTGYGNSNSNDTIFGFVSQNGGCNIFENSIANGTQGANITDFNALVAGFALRGSESCSKIIGSESANATTSSNGVTIPYGILLEGSLGSALTLTAYPPVPAPGGERVLTLEWSPDQKLLAVGTDSGDGNVVIGLYSVDNTDKTVSLIATPDLVPTATVNSISWHPSGQFIAAGIDTEDAYKVRVYEYCPNNNSLKQVATPNIIPGGDVTSVDWSPNGKYLAVSGTDDVVRIYAFDAVEYTLTQIITQSVTGFQALEWHPSGRFLGVVTSSDFYAYGFNSGSSSLTVAATQPTPNAFLSMLSWTADGKYLALVNADDYGEGVSYTIETFLFNGQSLIPGATIDTGTNFVNDLDWSSDGRYLAAIISSQVRAYPFDRTGSTSFGSPVIQNMGITNESEITLNWSPDGQYIAVGLECLAPDHGESCTTIGIALYEALSFPHKNVITNNTVYCNSGNMCPGGVGISGSSIANMIIGNTAYANPIPQSINHPFVQTNYVFVTNIFNQLFGQAPSDVQNISIDACEPICAPTDLALIAKQIKYKVEVIESKIDNLGGVPCAPTPIFVSTTITAEGVYCLANMITGPIRISQSDVVLDMSECRVDGGIVMDGGIERITVMNGVVQNSGGSAIAAGPTVTNVTIENVLACDSTTGIFLDSTSGGAIINSKMANNSTGLLLNNSYKIEVIDSVAVGNTLIGFSLMSSSSNSFKDCSAINTGVGNTQTANNEVFGFVSKDGHSNIFERCIANATQALSTTDSQSIVAGFALRGDEKCTKIIDSEAANSTTSASGVTVPYGILLEAQLDGLVSVTNQPDAINSPRSVAWSPDQKYLAAAINGDDKIEVYEFDQNTQSLTKVAEQLNAGDQPQHVSWSPDSRYIACSFIGNGDKIAVYEFNRSSQSLTFIDQQEVLGNAVEVEWSYDGRYLAVAISTPIQKISIYEFNSVSESIRFVTNQQEVISNPQAISWSPDNKYTAAAVFSDNTINIYQFDITSETLILVYSQSFLPDFNAITVAWSPDGKYIAAGGNSAVRIYEFDRSLGTAGELLLIAQQTDNTFDVSWSPDGKYVAVVVFSDTIKVYEFDRSSGSLVLKSIQSGLTNPQEAVWSPDGQYIALALGTGNEITIYSILSFPSKNVITNNTVYCNSGGNCPSGVGISGSSIQNLIIGNTAYSNPVPQSANHPIVGSNYQFVTNVFSQLFGQAPSDLQNISVDGCAPICTPIDVGLLAQQIKYKVCVPIPSQLDVIESKIDAISLVCDLQPVLNAISQTEAVLCSKLEIIDSQSDVIESKIDVLPFGATQIDIAISTQIDINASLQEVIDVIQSGDAVLCSKLEIIDSQLDVVESKIDILPFGATQIDIAISTQIDINASLQEVIDVIQSGDEILCSKLEVIEQKIDNITSSAMASPCTPTAITAPTTITAEGVYCVANTIAGEIEINGSDIVVDLNGYDIQGGIDILSGSDNVTILNGTVSGASDAIHVEGATNITLENVKTRNATAGGGEHGVGIHFVNVLGGLIKNCEMTQNLTGLEFNNSHNITVDHSIAAANSYAGFSLISSFTNCFRDCKSISTGAGNNQTSGNIFGFVSRNGGCNIFENSIANGTQGLGITDCNALVAGFALRGSESCSKIINSESANTTTNPNGLAIPYGILLEDVFDVPNPNYPDPDFITGEFLITLTAVPVIPTPSADVQAIQWRPDQKYFAAGYDSAVSVYSFNSVTYVASKVADGAAAPSGTVTHLDWSPDGKYLAVGTTSGVFVYEFCTINCTLTLINTVSLSNVSSVDWHPTAKYLAVATNGPDFSNVYVYTFDRVAQSLTQLFTPALSTTNPVNDLEWSPDGNYLAVVDSDDSADNDLFVYRFNNNNSQLALASSVGFGSINVHAVAWRFDGKYIAVGGDQSLNVFEISNGVIDPTAWGYLQGDTIYSLDWSSNGKYIVIGTDASATAMPDYMQVIQFDPCQAKGTPCDGLVLIAVPNTPPIGTSYEAVNSVDWSPDGQFILAGTDDNNLRIAIYDALSFPTKNVIKNNTVYCNSGGSCPSGIGISGSSVANMIIGNTAYSNPVHPPVIDSNYVFVTNVFDQLFGNIPSDLQNISLNGCEPICQPEDLGLLIKQNRAIICSKLDIQQILLQSLIDNLL